MKVAWNYPVKLIQNFRFGKCGKLVVISKQPAIATYTYSWHPPQGPMSGGMGNGNPRVSYDDDIPMRSFQDILIFRISSLLRNNYYCTNTMFCTNTLPVRTNSGAQVTHRIMIENESSIVSWLNIRCCGSWSKYYHTKYVNRLQNNQQLCAKHRILKVSTIFDACSK
jgi:hypothetical protein